MRIPILLIGLLVAAAIQPAMAQSPLEIEFDVETVAVISPLAKDEGATDSEGLLAELSLETQAEKVLDNGVRLRARSVLRAQRDHPARPGGSAGFGTAQLATSGGFSGLSSGPTLDQNDIRARFETAYFQIDGGYGEVRIGKDQGVAARFHEGAKSVLSHARLDSTLLDPSGLSVIRTRHDLTGPSLKFSYATPRIVGLRAGISITPEANADGLDRRPARGSGATLPDMESAVELALNGSHLFRNSGWRVEAALAWSGADISAYDPLTQTDRIETWSAGTRLSQGDWTFGASWLGSDNGLLNGDYEAWSAGLARTAWATDFSFDYGEARDDGALIDSSGWRLGAARSFGKGQTIALAYRRDDLSNPQHSWDSQGIVVEITLSSEIHKLTVN